jgi:type 1 glutamine amidotransferase
LDHSFEGLFPEYLLSGFPAWQYPDQVFAGLVVGWVHQAAPIAARRDYGKGTVVYSTFALTPASLEATPMAAALLDGLLTAVTASGA